jgi:hypothetical protein
MLVLQVQEHHHVALELLLQPLDDGGIGVWGELSDRSPVGPHPRTAMSKPSRPPPSRSRRIRAVPSMQN